MLSAALERILGEAEANEKQFETLVAGLGEEDLARRPRLKSWSIAEILIHLRLTNEACLPAIDRAMEEARREGLLSDGPFRLSRMGRFFVWYVVPPPVIRLPAPRVLRPLLEGRASEALPQLLASRRAVLERMKMAERIDLVRARFVSPFASVVKMDLLSVFSVFTAHERRHLWQGENVRKAFEKCDGKANLHSS